MAERTLKSGRRRASLRTRESPLLKVNVLSVLIWTIGVMAIVVLNGRPVHASVVFIVGAVFLIAGLSPRNGDGFTPLDIVRSLRELTNEESELDSEENNHG